MKGKTTTVRLVICVVLLAVGFLGFWRWYNADRFTGNREKKPDSYTLEFNSMQGVDCHSMQLPKDGRLTVEFAILKGRVDLLITDGDGNTAYRGDDIKAGCFQVEAPGGGKYTVTVTAKHAAGYVDIYAGTELPEA